MRKTERRGRRKTGKKREEGKETDSEIREVGRGKERAERGNGREVYNEED